MSVRIGADAAFSNDRIAPAVYLVRYGKLDFHGIECLAERIAAQNQVLRMQNSSKGYNPQQERRRSGAEVQRGIAPGTHEKTGAIGRDLSFKYDFIV